MINLTNKLTNIDHVTQTPESFAGFVSHETSKKLKVNTSYKLRLSKGVRIGTRIQFVATLLSSNGEKVKGYLVENFGIGTKYYQDFVMNAFLPTEAGIIAVDLSRLPEVAGMIELVEHHGRLHLNWDTFEPEATLVNFVAQ